MASYLGIAAGQVPPEHYFHLNRTFATDVRLRLPGDAAQRRDALLPRRRRLRGPLRLPRHAHRPDVGRRHVRGADGPALRARGALGPALVGRQPPALRARADRARPRRGALRLLGLLAERQPVGRLQRLRRRRHRDAGRRLSRTATTTARSSTTASATAGPPSPTRRPPPTPTASSRRTPRSWPCATRRGPRSPTSRGCARTSTSTARAASTTPSTSAPAKGEVARSYLALDQGMIMAAAANALSGDSPAQLLHRRRDRPAHPAAAGDGAVHRGLRAVYLAAPAALRGAYCRIEGGEKRGRGRPLHPQAGERREVLAMRAELVVHRARRRTTACAPRRRRLPSLDDAVHAARRHKRERTTKKPRA